MSELNKASVALATAAALGAASENKMFQHYTCSRPSVKLTTPTGIRIAFTNYTYLTQDETVIEYLDKEIAAGLGIITKGELLSKEDSDPMERLRKKHIEDYLAEQKAKQEAIGRGELPDMGTTGAKETLKTATTKDVAG